MSEKDLKEYCAKDERSLKELVDFLVERKAISFKIAKKYFGYCRGVKDERQTNRGC